MAYIETFDEFEAIDETSVASELKPFQFREDKSDKGTLEWLNDFFNASLKAAQPRFEVYRRYLNYFKNIQWKASAPRDYNRDSIDSGKRNPKMSINYFHETVEAKVSQRGRNRIAIAVLPNNSEQSDINNAQLYKMLLDHRGREIDIDGLNQDFDRIMFIFGHAFMHIYWDMNEGPLHPRFKMVKDNTINEEEKKKIEKLLEKKGLSELKVGDVKMCPIGPDKVFPELGKRSLDTCDYVNIIEWKPLEEVKAEYPKQAAEIEDGAGVKGTDGIDFKEYRQWENYVLVHTFYHRPTKYFPKGCKIVWVAGAILVNEDFPYEHKKLPLVEDKDIRVYDEFWGRSYLGNIEQLQRMNNNIQSAVARNEGVGSMPKWLVQKGSTKISGLNNEFTIVEYTGAIEPRLVPNNATHPRTLEIMDRNEKKIYNIATIYDISRGVVPTGVTANSALRFLDEQESQRDSIGVMNRKTRILKEYWFMKSLMRQYYRADDERTIKIIGVDNEYMIRSMKDVNTEADYDVKLQNVSALPDTKTGKISTIIDLNTASQTDPIFRREEIIQMLDLGMDETFKNEATVAVNAAKTAVDMLLRGEQIPEPKVSDNFIVHYGIFVRTMQSFTFRDTVSKEIQLAFEQYIMTLEYLMFERAKKNFKFLQELLTLDMYPIYFKPEIPVFQLQQMMMAPPAAPAATNPPVQTEKMKNMPTQNKEE